MNYLQRNKTKSIKWRIALVAILVFVIAALLLPFVKSPLITLFSPLWQAENKVSQTTVNTLSFFRTKNSLIKENQDLKFRLQSYEAERLTYRSWQERETELMNLLGRENEQEGVVASVIAHPPQTPYDILVVDLGSSSGVLDGQKVRMPEGPLLGTIVESLNTSAKVKLFSSSGTEINAVLERGNVSIVLVGIGGGMFKFSLPRDVEVQSGDRILSTELRADLLAVVGDISLKSTDSFKEVRAKGPTNIFNTRFVIISK